MQKDIRNMSDKKNKKIIQKSVLASLFMTSVLLAGCASQSLKAPCPDYGRYCEKTPVNSWDTSTV